MSFKFMTEQLNKRINVVLTTLLAFFIPLFPNILPILIVLIALNWLIFVPNFSNSFGVIKDNKGLQLMILLYIFHVIGLTYTSNYYFASEILETKFSFLIIPLTFAAYLYVIKTNFYKYLKFFIYGCLAYSLFCFGYACYAFFKPVYTDLYGVLYNLGANYFYYSYLSSVFHPSYISMYSIIALFGILYLSKEKIIAIDFKWIAAILFLSFFVLLLSSKAGWIGLLLFYVFCFVHFVKKKKLISILGLIILVLSFFLALNVYYTPDFSKRIPKIETIKNAINEKDGNNQTVTTGSDGSGSRIFVWKAAVEIIKENFLFGVGTGDSKDKMLQKYLEKGMLTEYNFGLNSHNQFLNTAISIGILGLLLLMSMFGLTFYYGIKYNELLLYSFSLIVSLNLLFESMFERQSGVIFFVFLNTLICLKFLPNKK